MLRHIVGAAFEEQNLVGGITGTEVQLNLGGKKVKEEENLGWSPGSPDAVELWEKGGAQKEAGKQHPEFWGGKGW